MREERLLERIRSWEREPNRRERPDERRLIDSILNHLQKILNTRQGNVPIADDYGVPDFTELMQGMPDSVREMETSIRNAIVKYEPRLQRVRVTLLPPEDDPLTLRFEVRARLTEVPGSDLYFESVIDSDGKVRIRR